jgi:hypothetical protein
MRDDVRKIRDIVEPPRVPALFRLLELATDIAELSQKTLG